jgi:hypothetical protein
MAIDTQGASAGSGIGGGVGSAAGGIAVLLGAGGKGGDAERKRALQVWDKLKAVDFDFREIPAPDLKVFATIFPQLYTAVAPLQPTLVKDSGEMRDVQLRSLAHLERVAQEGLPTAERVAAQEAQRSVGNEAQRAQESALEDLAQRGRLSGGDEIAARIVGNQGARNMAAQQGADLAKLSSANRLYGTQAAADLAGNVRGADTALSGRNADIINRFNEIVSQLGTEQAQANAAATNQANFYNAQTKQQVGTQNALGGYEAATANLQRKNALKQQGYENELARLKGLTVQLDSLAEQKDEERRNKIAAISGIGQGVGSIAGGAIGGGLLG